MNENIDLVDTGMDGNHHYIVLPKRKRWDMMVCQYCRQYRRLCPVCAGVI